MTIRKIATSLEEVEGLMITPDGDNQILDGVVDNVPPEKGCEVLNGEFTHA